MTDKEKLQEVIYDITEGYRQFRMIGKNRDETIKLIKDQYSEELKDADDRVAVLSGLALALCKRKELIYSIAEETVREINIVLESKEADRDTEKYYHKILGKIQNDSMQGEEAIYRRHTPYNPDWEIGDLFCHTLVCPEAEALGVAGWSILFYKYGEYIDYTERVRQIMYVSLCPPGKEPLNAAQLEKLGFLKMMCHDAKWDYWVQLSPRSKREEQDYEFKKIGNFKSVLPPEDQMEENPLVAMPMFGRLRKDDLYPSYEKDICHLLKEFGKYLPGFA